MKQFIVKNMSTGEEYKGADLEEVFNRAKWDQLPNEKLTVKSVPLPANHREVQELIAYMMKMDPNGTWDEEDIEVSILLQCMISTLTGWANEETDQLDKAKLYRKIMEVEALLK